MGMLNTLQGMQMQREGYELRDQWPQRSVGLKWSWHILLDVVAPGCQETGDKVCSIAGKQTLPRFSWPLPVLSFLSPRFKECLDF